MSTPRQIAANRRNAQLSTGPATSDGRAASSLNARTHGLTARQIVIDTEDRQQFEDLRRDFLEEHQPATAVEILLVEQMIAAAWRLRRVRYLETEAINLRLMDHEISRYENPGPGMRLAHAMNEGFSNLNPFGNLARYHSTLERSFFRALHELARLRAASSQTKITKRSQSQNRTPEPEQSPPPSPEPEEPPQAPPQPEQPQPPAEPAVRTLPPRDALDHARDVRRAAGRHGGSNHEITESQNRQWLQHWQSRAGPCARQRASNTAILKPTFDLPHSAASGFL